ncbi:MULTISPECIES: SH3 domain-containing protein [Exiguobacterium]|uniref:SH3 domain-containing protein n=1 Tax=Exiguobacterium TaxID=33986 RepID=UPI001AE3C105|nr:MULTISPECIES: SH3 domain-containing protein [Exiguobacterium]MCT4779715.1 SH3 domain-containing protein [Exiguobacterium soli]
MNTTLFTKILKMLVSFIMVLGILVSYSPSLEAATTKPTTYRLSTDTYLYDKTTSSRKRLLTIKTGTIVSSTYVSSSGHFRRVSYDGKTGYVASKYLAAYDKKESITGQRFLVSKKTTLHKSASTTAPVIATLNEQDAYYSSQKITNSLGEVWYRVTYDGQTAYVRSLNATPISYTKLSKATLTTTDGYILRQYAGTSYPRQLVVPTGTSLQTAGRIGDWYNVTYAGKSGYMHKAAFVGSSKQEITTIPETAFKTKASTVLYDTTVGTKRPLVTIPSGSIVKSTALSGLYHRVTYAGKTGYVLTATLAEYTTTVKLAASRFLLSTEVEIKTKPLSSSATLASLQTGNVYYTTQLVTNSTGEQWHKISKDGKTGYVKINQGKTIKYYTTHDLSLKTTTATSLHSYAGPSYGVVKTIPSGTVIKIQGQIGNWYKVSYGGKSGYASGATFTDHVLTQSIPTADFKLKTDVAMKVAPKATATMITTLKTDDIYQTNQLVTNGSSKWHRVTKDGQTGYIPVDQGTPVSYAPENMAMKATATTALRTYAGNSYAAIATITNGTNVQIIGKIQDWYKVSSNGKTGYVTANTMTELITKKTLPASRFVLSKSVDVKTSHHSTADTLTTLTNNDVYYTTQLVTNGRSEQWHRMTVDGKTGYVRVNQGTSIAYKTLPATKYKTSSTTPLRSYAGPSYASLTTIPSDTVITVTGQVGNWMKITYGAKSGYAAVSTLSEFTETNVIPEVRFLLDAPIAVKSEAKDSSATIATLNKGNVYTTKTLVTTSANVQWHQVTVNGKTGYIKLGQPTSPISYEPIEKSFIRATGTTLLRSYVGDAYQLVASVPLDTVLPVTGKIGNWYEVSYEGKTLYAYNGTLVMTSSKLNIYNSVATPYTFDSFISAQMKLNPPPQTDLYASKLMYVSASYVRLGGSLDPVNGTIASVTATTPLNIRSGATTASHVYGQFEPSTMIKVYQNVSGFYTTYPRVYTSTTRYSTIYWLNALEADVRNTADPLKVDRQSSAYYQFLDLSKSTGATAATLNKILATKGIFGKCTTGSCGQAFIDAGAKYSLNEAYLISHALLETGNGSSTLATGVVWNGRTVYNMYGIGAYDYDAINTGAAYAYSQGWFTPEAAIIGGAEFISTKYIHNQYDQNTLYKMRWSPMRPGVHQYATDMGWAVKQTTQIYNLYQQMESYTAVFDIPVFAR